jgi:hypothetical protein
MGRFRYSLEEGASVMVRIARRTRTQFCRIERVRGSVQRPTYKCLKREGASGNHQLLTV